MNEGMPASPAASTTSPSPAAPKNRWAWIIVIIAIVAIAAGAYWHYRNRGNNTNGASVTQIAPGTFFTKAAAGTLVADFPAGLIVEKGVTIGQSYSISYQNGKMKQPVVDYTSAMSVRDNIGAFRTYLVQNGWDILQSGQATNNPASILATKNNEQVNIRLQALPTGQTAVSIVYLVNG